MKIKIENALLLYHTTYMRRLFIQVRSLGFTQVTYPCLCLGGYSNALTDGYANELDHATTTVQWNSYNSHSLHIWRMWWWFEEFDWLSWMLFDKSFNHMLQLIKCLIFYRIKSCSLNRWNKPTKINLVSFNILECLQGLRVLIGWFWWLLPQSSNQNPFGVLFFDNDR